jgi:hypothetical protein
MMAHPASRKAWSPEHDIIIHGRRPPAALGLSPGLSVQSRTRWRTTAALGMAFLIPVRQIHAMVCQ